MIWVCLDGSLNEWRVVESEADCYDVGARLCLLEVAVLAAARRCKWAR